MQFLILKYRISINLLNFLSPYLALLAIRVLLGWEYGEAGYEKLHGTNWFEGLAFPFPFNLLPSSISWEISKWAELIGAAALILGFATRFLSISLLVLTVVAIASAHWPDHWSSYSELLKGYRIIDEDGDGYGNYKLPVMYLAMLLPIIFMGPGRFSIDNIIYKYFNKS